MLSHHLGEHRIAVGGANPELSAFPLAEVDLTKVGLDDRDQTEQRREGSGGLVGAPQRRDVDGGDVLGRGKTIGQCLGLGPAAPSAVPSAPMAELVDALG